MVQQLGVVVGQAVLHHGQHVQGRVGEVVKPVPAPVCWRKEGHMMVT